MKDKKKISIIVLSLFAIVAVIGVTYAFISESLTGTKEVVISAGTLDLVLEEENAITISNALPMYDEVGMIQEPFTFSLVNNGINAVDYKLKLVDVTPQTVERKCSELGEITLDSPAGCRETVYPEELREEALMICQNWYSYVTSEEECLTANEEDGYHYNSFEDFIDEGIYYGNLEDTRTLRETYPDNVVEVSVWELYDRIIRYGLTRNNDNIIGSVSDMEYTWKITNPELRAEALDECKKWYLGVTDEASCLEANVTDGKKYETFDDFVVDAVQFNNGGKSFALDKGEIGANETINYDLRLWISEYVEYIEDIKDSTFSFKIEVEINQKVKFIPITEQLQLESKVLESTSTFPDFTQISSETNGRGIYKYLENGEEIYYWRGNVSEVEGADNHLIFANLCWEIVRTTSTGGVKIIYDGEPVETDGVMTCPNTGAESITRISNFNYYVSQSNSSIAHVGYMYGKTKYNDKVVTGDDSSLTTAGVLFGYDVEWTGEEYILKTKEEGGNLYSSVGNWYFDRENIPKGNHYTCFNTTGRCETVSYIYDTSDKFWSSSGDSTKDYSDIYYIDLSNGVTIEQALEQMFSNQNNSNIKAYIDNWFVTTDLVKEENLNKLEDIVYCNDRSSVDMSLNGWSKYGDTTKNFYFSSYTRYKKGTPDLNCINEAGNRDRFTYKDTTIGNGDLTYPVGLLTADEVILAGGQNSNNSDYYLNTGRAWWTMSPYYYGNYSTALFNINSSGKLNFQYASNYSDIRPVVSLASNVVITGLGTEERPYEVK